MKHTQSCLQSEDIITEGILFFVWHFPMTPLNHLPNQIPENNSNHFCVCSKTIDVISISTVGSLPGGDICFLLFPRNATRSTVVVGLLSIVLGLSRRDCRFIRDILAF